MNNPSIPNWFGVGTMCLDELELKEKLEYEKAQLEMLRMDIANTELRIASMEDKLSAE